MRQTFLIPLIASCAALLSAQAATAAGSCDAVVDDTIAEIRAGADSWWSNDLENLARAAAGSACVKARSQRYAGSASPNAGSLADSRLVTPEPAVESEGSRSRIAAGSAATSDASGASAAEEDGQSLSVGGLTFRSMSGSPAKKPYERVRDSKGADDTKKDPDQGR